MPTLTLRFKKRADAGTVLTFHRGDGSWTSSEIGPQGGYGPLHDLAHLEAGDVTVGCVFSAVHHFLPGVIRSFREQHPHVLVRLIEEGAQEVLASVKSGEADFALNYTGMQDPEVEFTNLLNKAVALAVRYVPQWIVQLVGRRLAKSYRKT